MDIKRKCFEESKNVNPDWSFKFDEELQQYIALDSEMELQVDEFNEHWDTFRAGWQAAKAQTPVKLDKDTARQKLAMMWRGESTEINGRTVIFNESGCFDVRQNFSSGHFSQSLKATLDYLFEQRKSL